MKKIYLNEYNLRMDNAIYFPLASGMLRAYAETFKEVKDKYKFMPFNFEIEEPDKIASRHIDPSIAAFSVSMWNYNLSIEVAKRVKRKYPKCLIVFGGPSVPNKVSYPIDHIIRGEGEHEFAKLLLGINLPKPTDINSYPSPYFLGLFDYMIDDKTQFQAIVETNRGCHNSCSYCYWGHGGLEKKYKLFDIEQIKQTAEWIGKNKIKYVFCADSNFGMFDRDKEIAKIYSNVKKKYGYPEKFRVCYGKIEKVFDVAKILHKSNIAKAVTLSKQTDNQQSLININRKNIKSTTFESLKNKYDKAGIPTYTEFILGLPGETIESFKRGINNAIKYKNKLFIYHCSVLPNTQMAEKRYKQKHSIKTVIVKSTKIHCSPTNNVPQEYEDIIIKTNTMTVDDWKEMTVFAWTIQLIHSLRYDGKIFEWIKQYFNNICNSILDGESRGQIIPEAGNIYWEPEEAAYILLHKDKVSNLKEFAINNILYGRK